MAKPIRSNRSSLTTTKKNASAQGRRQFALRAACMERLEARQLLSTSTWTGAGTTPNWSDAGNWDVLPVGGEDLVFPDVSAGSNVFNPNNDFTAGTSFHSITIDGPGYHLNGNAIDLVAGINDTSNFSGEEVHMPITLTAPQTFTNANGNNTLQFFGDVTAGANNLSVLGNQGTIRFEGALNSTANITVLSNAGDPDAVAFDGATTGAITGQTDAVIFVHGDASAATFSLATGATISGDGITGALNIGTSGAGFHPGNFSGARGTLNTGNLTLGSGLNFVSELAGATAHVGVADQVSVTGTVNLAGGTLQAVYDHTATIVAGDVYTIVANDSTDAITGTFAGLPEGSLVSVSPDSGGGAAKNFRLSYVGGTGNDVTLTAANPGTLAFSAATYSVNEGQPTATITITRAVGADGPASVDFATSNGTATAGSDYTATTGTINFADGDTSKTVTVPITDDAAPEGDETVLLALTNPVNATLGAQTAATLTIHDNDVPSLTVANVSAAEGNSGSSNATFTVTLSAASTQTVTVNYATADGTATTADNDYTAASGMLTFAPGDTTKTVNVPILGDTAFESDETFTLALSSATNASVSGSNGTATGTITNDDTAPTLAINDVSITEGDSGTSNAVFTVTLTGATHLPATVNFSTADATAVAGTDYTATAGLLTFAPGETTKTITVAVNGDTVAQGNRTFLVDLATPTNATIADPQGTGSIIDNDNANVPPVAVNDTATTTAGTAVTIDVLANDTDINNDTLSITSVGSPTAPTLGTAVISNGKILYTPSANAAGTDTFTYAISDGNGGTASGTVTVDITGVTTTTDPNNPTKTAVIITGTSGNDTITFAAGKKKNTTQVILNGTNLGTFNQPSGSFVINGGDGNDFIDARKIKVKNSVVIDGGNGDDIIFGTAQNDIIRGGAGNDYINAGNGNNVIIGGDGVDILQGGSGKDILIGGAGLDFPFGGSGNDILIGGATSFDADTPANNLALTELSASWAKGSNYTKALAAVTAAAGVGSSHANFSTTTITDDATVDTLKGNSGTDAFFGHFSGTGTLDVISDKSKGEVAVEIAPVS